MSAAYNTVAAVFVSLGGGGAIVLALSGWLGRVWAGRILAEDRAKYRAELERLKGELEARNRQLQGEIDQTIHVHRLHFETEFRALRVIWRRVARMRRDMSSLRPMFRIGPMDQSGEEEFEELQRRFSKFTDAFDLAINTVDDNLPFLTEDLYTRLDAVLRAAQAEHISIRLHGRCRDEIPDWYETGQKNFNAVEAHLSEIVGLIRARLRVLAVYPE